MSIWNMEENIATSTALQINVGWQLCPKCHGDGNLGRYNSPNIFTAIPICDVCNGKKIISILTGLPPML